MTGGSEQTAWIRFFCGRDRRGRMATFRKVRSEWQLTSVADKGPSGGQPGRLAVSGQFGLAPEYAGCPGCRADSYVRCGNCSNLSCWNSATTTFACGSCNNRGDVSGRIDSSRLTPSTGRT